MTQFASQAFQPKEVEGLNIESIIGAPLVAAAKANSMMLAEQTRFLLEFCFNKKDDDTYDPIMVQMTLTRSVMDNDKDPDDPEYLQRVQVVFNLPIITMIPISSLAVDKVTVEFDMEVTSQSTEESNSSQLFQKHFGSSSETAQLKGKISYDAKENQNQKQSSQYKSQNSSKLNVNVDVAQLPLPIGVNTMLDLYVKSIQPITVSNGENTGNQPVPAVLPVKKKKKKKKKK